MRFGTATTWAFITGAYILILSIIMFARSDEPKISRTTCAHAPDGEACAAAASAIASGDIAMNYSGADRSPSRLNCR